MTNGGVSCPPELSHQEEQGESSLGAFIAIEDTRTDLGRAQLGTLVIPAWWSAVVYDLKKLQWHRKWVSVLQL